ncbi:glycosyltransferase family 39 protein [Patescibacteria group bacterium]|nr:glycosyltransferase family 39 protein [Patescibacteria group bacterium]MBU4017030.1 glycosyltransferase family 39 protein [Patescibacteria group bacterium]MBU4099617.1 glycosyltransferase family 39 protein [Patescibacteria group bacterium]
MKDKVITSISTVQSFYKKQATKLVILYSLVVGLLATFYFYSNHLITVLVDQNAHLNIARQVIDSLTPGVSQFGSWPPFTQIIIIPFVWNDFLWHSGLAGSIPVLICFIITTVFLYKSVLFLSKSHFASIISILLFSLNPNILELAVSPLMEMPFLMFSVLTFYYVCRWVKEERVIYLFASAFFSTMAVLTRFDGFIFPFVIAGIIILKYLFLRKGMRHLEATLIVFLFLGLFGIAIDLAYNTVFLGDPLAFARGNWSAYAQQHIGGVRFYQVSII